MRYIVWFLLIFAVAVVAAVTLGRNDGLVAIAWRDWRVELSLNLFLATTVLACVALVMTLQALDSLLSLPKRARDWRVLNRDRAAQGALREALAEHFAARYRRSQKAAVRSVAMLEETPEIDQDGHARQLAHLLSAASAHKLQDRAQRDHHLAAMTDAGSAGAGPRRGKLKPHGATQEGAQLLAVEWALDDRDAAKALTLIDALPPGASRRTQALRLKLQAQRLEGRATEALVTARLLAKHQAFAPHAARGLLRSLATEALQSTRDTDQMRQAWATLDAQERQDPLLVAHAAKRMTDLGAAATARQWLEPLWGRLAQMPNDERAAVALATAHASEGAEATWLARLEEATRRHPQDPAVSAAAGNVYAQHQLWGKARAALEQAAKSPDLATPARRQAWRTLGQLAREQGDEARAQQCDHAAAILEG